MNDIINISRLLYIKEKIHGSKDKKISEEMKKYFYFLSNNEIRNAYEAYNELFPPWYQ